MQEVCSKCGTNIKNVFLYRGNKYGSECIQNIPTEELFFQDESIDVTSIVQGFIYAKIKTGNLDFIPSMIPEIGSRIPINKYGAYKEVIGYGKHKRKLRGSKRRSKEEFAIRIKSIFPAHPRMNGEGWMYVDGILDAIKNGYVKINQSQ